MTVLDLLRGRVADRQTSHDETLAAAARRVAADESVNHDAVDAALAATGRTVDDFAGMVELARRRQRWRATVERGTAAQLRLDKATATAERERAQFEKTRDAWLVRARELEAELSAARRLVEAADQAAEELRRPENVPEPARKLVVDATNTHATARERVATLERERKTATEGLRHHEYWRDHHRKLNTSGPSGDAADHERFAVRAQRRVKELDGELVIARADLEDAERRLADATAHAGKA